MEHTCTNTRINMHLVYAKYGIYLVPSILYYASLLNIRKSSKQYQGMEQ